MHAGKTLEPICLTGHVDIHVLRRCLVSLRAQLGERTAPRFEVDCGAVTGFSAEAMVVLAKAIQTFRQAGGGLKLINLSADVLTGMRRTLLLEILERELTQGPGECIQKVADAIREGTRGYQYYWNN
jgi:anti-anti-sigma regulatory factor